MELEIAISCKGFAPRSRVPVIFFFAAANLHKAHAEG